MVTNTAGTAADVTSTKENGECKQNNEASDESSDTRKSSANNLKSHQTEQTAVPQQNDSNAMSNVKEQMENTSASAMAGNNSFNSRVYGNGLPTAPSSDSTYSGPRPGSNYSCSMQPRFPTNQQPATTPTLNQLLTAPARHPTQYAGYGNQPPEFGQSQQQPWPSKTQHERASKEHMKPDANSFPPQQQFYPPNPQHPNYPPQYGRYPSPGGPQAPYNHPQQQSSYNNIMVPSGQSGYPATNPSAPTQHPGYPGYPNYSQQSPYYAQRPQANYQAQALNSNPSNPADPYYQQQSQENQQQNAPQMQERMYQQQKESMMSPNRRTPQPAPSPMNASQPPPGHPSVAQFRGPPSAPGSPSVVSRGNPVSPASVRSDGPQPPMRPGSGHSEHSNPPAPSPLSGPAGTSGYGTFMSHSSRPNYAWKQQQSNYSQHMMSPQHQPSNSQDNITQGASGLRPSGPPSVGKPATSTAFSQSQPSPGFSQSGGHMPYYDTVPQHMMQGYNSASPAPSERRPSRQGSQGSQTPNVPTPEPAPRQGAAAAAAAAMAAAAHTAHLGNMPNQKQPSPGYLPPAQPQRPPHPGYNNIPQQNMDANQQNMNYPRMPHSGTPGPPPQRVMGPPGMTPQANQGGYRMPPPNHYSPGYGQPGGPSPQQGQYPAYYPQSGPGEPNHPRGAPPRPGYHTSPGYPPPKTPEEPTPKKPANRAASQKLNALYEPDEPGRRDFVEALLRYWDDKEVPLKNAPLMGRKTLDLFRLFHVIKDRGGMQEVTASKKWTEISTQLGMGSTSTSGFTLKKQYCKYLYGLECKDRGVPEPPEALSRVTEANRKRKQALEHPKDGVAAQASRMHPGQPFPPSQYQSNQYGPQYQMPQSHPAPGYPMQPNPAYTANAYPQHPGQLNAIGHQPGIPPPHNYPNPPSGARAWPQPGPVPAPGPMISSPNAMPGMVPGGVPQPPSQSQHNNNSLPPSVNQSPTVKPPPPPSGAVAAANPFSEPSVTPQPPSSALQAPASFSNMDHSKQAFAPRPSQDPQRPAPQPRPGMMPNQYPYSNSPVPHPSPLRGPTDIRGSPSPGPRTPYQPTPPMSTRPMTSGPHQIGGNGYAAATSYPGAKRSSTENYGPPRKFMRPNTPQAYSGNVAFRPGSEMLRHRFASPDTANTAYRPMGAPSPHSRLHGPYESHRFPRYLSDKTRGQHPYPAGGRYSSLKNRLQSPIASSTLQRYPRDPRPTLKRQLQMPARTLTHSKRELPMFPPGSIEATHLRLTKFQRKTCNNVGLFEGWRLIMSLKSGLLVESSWALNSLNILLYDQRSVAQLRLSQLPGLLDTIVEHYRRFLSEIFNESSERKALGVSSCGIECEDLLDAETTENICPCPVSKPKQSKKKRKGAHTPKFKRKNMPYKVKIESRSDPFLEDNSHKWDYWKKMDVNDDLAHIVLTLSRPIALENNMKEEERRVDAGSPVRCVEATLDDVLSIPCSVLCPDVYDITKSSLPSVEKSKAPCKSKEDGEGKAKAIVETSNHQKSNPKTNLSVKNDGATQRRRSTSKIENGATKTEEKMDTIEPQNTDKNRLDSDSKTNSTESSKESAKNETPKGSKTEKEPNKFSHSCNGLQVSFSLRKQNKDSEKESAVISNGLIKSEMLVSTSAEELHASSDPPTLDEKASKVLNLSAKVKELLEEKKVVILEDEVVGSDGCIADPISGPLLCSKLKSSRKELVDHLLSISNVLRSLSFIPINVEELLRQNHLMKALSGILLLRHKHKVRKRADLASIDTPECDSVPSRPPAAAMPKIKAEQEKSSNLLKNNKMIHDQTNEKINCAKVSLRRFSKAPARKSASEEDLFAPRKSTSEEEVFAPRKSTSEEEVFAPRKCTSEGELFASASVKQEKPPKNYLFSSSVFVKERDDLIFKDPWWWDYVRRLREDAMTFLANIASSLDLSLYHDDSIPMALLEGCLHWTTCPSSDACDAFSHKPIHYLSAQRLAVEILTKLSIKEQNVDLMLATRPYCKLEKLFNHLVCAIGNKRDKVMREYSVVLLSNLSRGDPGAARIIALQGAAITNFITFLEDCEESGASNRQMFHQNEINCGTTVFMMVKAANTLLSMATVPENKPSFSKYQLRLLSLSMSHFLGPAVTSIVSSVLFEISRSNS